MMNQMRTPTIISLCKFTQKNVFPPSPTYLNSTKIILVSFKKISAFFISLTLNYGNQALS